MNILMFVNKDSRYDPRVQKESESIVAQGHSIRILSAIQSETKDSPLLFVIKMASLWFAWLRMCHKSDADIVHTHDFDTYPIAFLIAKLNDKPLIYDAHDHYSNMIQADAPNIVCSLIALIEKHLMNHTDHIVVATDNLKLNLPSKNKNYTTLLNCAHAPDKVRPNPRGHLRLSYIGSLEPGRGILEAIAAVKTTKTWGMFIAGSGSLQKKIEEKQCERIVYLGKIEPEFAQKLVSISDAQMICCDPNVPIHKIGIPTRLFEAMAYGKPSIATYHTKAGDIVKETDSGYLCGYGTLPLMNLLQHLEQFPEELHTHGANAFKAYQNKYSWAREERKLLKVYESLSSNAFITDTTIRNKEL